MKYLSLFSGIGGFELGIQQAYESILDNQSETKQLQTKQDFSSDNGDMLQGTPTCIGYSEIDKYAIQVYEKHFPNHKAYGDITKINADELPDFDFLVGGFPCQAFSIAGKRRGFDDTRGTLFFDIARILKAKQPRFFVLENVKGLLSHDNGRTFKTIITTLAELGYAVEWQVLNAKNHGVPQNRERVFIIGHLGGFSGRQVFPLQKNDGFSIERQGKVSPTITRRYYKQGQSDPYIVTEKSESIEQGVSQKGSESDNTNGRWRKTYSTDTRVIPVLTPDRLVKRQNGRRFKEDGEPSFTLNTQDKHGIYDGMKIRRLTPIECERLMGLPDGWTAEGTQGKISDTQRYKMCGNGIVTNVVRDVFENILTN